MKKIKYILLLITIFIFKMNVSATTIDLNLDCPESTYSSTTIDCKVKSNVYDGSLKELSGSYEFDKAEYSTFELNNNYKSVNNTSEYFKINGNIISSNIGTLKVFINGRSNETSTIKIKNIKGIDSNNKEVKANDISKIVNILEHTVENDTNKKILYLNDLKVDGYEIEFNKNIFEYELNVDYEVKNIDVTASSDYEVSGVGRILLKEGENTIVIKVSDNDDITNYKIKVNRGKKLNNVVNNNITEIEEAFKSNKDLIINLNKENDILKVNKEVLDIIKNKKRTLTYNILENNEIIYSFIFNGSKFNNINNNIDLELYLTNDKNGIYISNYYTKDYPKGTLLKVKNISNYKDTINLKLYDKDLNIIDKNLKINDNYIECNINKGTDYIISNKMLNTNNKKNIIIITILFILIIIFIILWYLYNRNKNKIEIPKLKDYVENNNDV